MPTSIVQHVSFDLGKIVATPGALDALGRNDASGMSLVHRHARGDWGEIEAEDQQSNMSALETGARLMSSYTLDDGTNIWVITDAEIDERHHRQATTLLLPDEY